MSSTVLAVGSGVCSRVVRGFMDGGSLASKCAGAEDGFFKPYDTAFINRFGIDSRKTETAMMGPRMIWRIAAGAATVLGLSLLA